MAAAPELEAVIAQHIGAVNAFDIDAILETFAEDALVNDASREFWGRERIRAWVTRELVGDHVTVDPIDVVDNAGLAAVRCRYDGDYDKSGLPDPLIMTSYFRVRGGKITALFVIKNREPQY